MEGYSDEELIYLYRIGNEEAYCFLYKRYQGYIKNWLITHMVDLDVVFDRDDLIMLALSYLDDVIEHYRNDLGTSFKTFARLVISRRIQNFFYRKKMKKKMYGNEMISLDQFLGYDEKMTLQEIVKDPKESYQPENYMIVKDDTFMYQTYIKENLSSKERKVMAYLRKGYTQEEISIKLAISKKSVYNAAYRYNQKMKDIDWINEMC